MGKVDLFAHVGVFYADTDVNLSASVPGQSEIDSFSDSN
jgi:hypothetical protein